LKQCSLRLPICRSVEDGGRKMDGKVRIRVFIERYRKRKDNKGMGKIRDEEVRWGKGNV